MPFRSVSSLGVCRGQARESALAGRRFFREYLRRYGRFGLKMCVQYLIGCLHFVYFRYLNAAAVFAAVEELVAGSDEDVVRFESQEFHELVTGGSDVNLSIKLEIRNLFK